jgi:hypothetical protein
MEPVWAFTHLLGRTPIAQICTPIGKTAHLSKIKAGYRDVIYIRNNNQSLR